MLFTSSFIFFPVQSSSFPQSYAFSGRNTPKKYPFICVKSDNNSFCSLVSALPFIFNILRLDTSPQKQQIIQFRSLRSFKNTPLKLPIKSIYPLRSSVFLVLSTSIPRAKHGSFYFSLSDAFTTRLALAFFFPILTMGTSFYDSFSQLREDYLYQFLIFEYPLCISEMTALPFSERLTIGSSLGLAVWARKCSKVFQWLQKLSIWIQVSKKIIVIKLYDIRCNPCFTRILFHHLIQNHIHSMGACETHPESHEFSEEQKASHALNPFFSPQPSDQNEYSILSKYEFISNYEDRFLGRCSVVSSRQSGDLYLCKDIGFENEQMCDSVYRTLLEKKEQQGGCEELLRIRQIFHRKVEGFFRDSKKILLVLEYPLVSLKREFHNRMLNKLQFDKEEITRILYSAIRGYATIERAGSANNKVRMAHIFVGVQSKESTIKVIDSGLLSGPSNLQCLIVNGADSNEHHDVYLAPEEFRSYFVKNNLGSSPKSGVFSLGITILDLCLMEPSRNAYHFSRKVLQEKELTNLVKIAGKRHGNNIEKFLLDMLQMDTIKRPTFAELQARIPNMFRQSAVGNSSLRLSVIKKDNSRYIQNDAGSLKNSRVGSVYSSRSSQGGSRVFASSIRTIKVEDEEIQNIHEEYTNGNQYIGQKKQGLKHGKGKYIFNDRSYYEGNWKNNMMHGKGVLYFSNGKIEYEGEWAEDEPDGWGVYYSYQTQGKPYIWKKYEGQLRKGEMDGRGKLIFANDSIYEGEFKLGKIFGRGRKISEGVVVQREWQLQSLQQFWNSKVPPALDP